MITSSSWVRGVNLAISLKFFWSKLDGCTHTNLLLSSLVRKCEYTHALGVFPVPASDAFTHRGSFIIRDRSAI